MRRIGFVPIIRVDFGGDDSLAGLAVAHVNANGNGVDIESVTEYVAEHG